MSAGSDCNQTGLCVIGPFPVAAGGIFGKGPRLTQPCHGVTYYPWYTLFTAIIITISYSTAILSLRVCSVTFTSIGYVKYKNISRATFADISGSI